MIVSSSFIDDILYSIFSGGTTSISSWRCMVRGAEKDAGDSLKIKTYNVHFPFILLIHMLPYK